jgi:hypothetical protein
MEAIRNKVTMLQYVINNLRMFQKVHGHSTGNKGWIYDKTGGE